MQKIKNLFKKTSAKIILALSTLLIIFNFIYSPQAEAKSFIEAAGGKLLEPITDFIVFLDDSILNALQKNLMVDQDVVLEATSPDEQGNILSDVLIGLGGVALVVVGVALSPFTAGASLGIAASGGIVLAGLGTAIYATYQMSEKLKGAYDLPFIAYTPAAIFSNSIPVFDINFFSPNSAEFGSTDIGSEDVQIQYQSTSSAAILAPSVSSWYLSFRNLVIVLMLSVLVFIGIRIILNSTSESRAKYKEMLLNWLLALCLLFILHYFMAFMVTLAENFTDLVATNCSDTVVVTLPKDTKLDGTKLENDPDIGAPTWATNFMGVARLSVGSVDAMESLEFTVIYTVLVIYTVIFTLVYLKRVLYMAFLTMISPLVAFAYPFEKLNGGHSKALSMWFKEYLFNLLIQPLHLILYTALVGSALQLATDHPIYAIVAIGFMMPAEKLLRKLFSLESSTLGDSGRTGAAVTGGLMAAIGGAAALSAKAANKTSDSLPDESKIRIDRNQEKPLLNGNDESDNYNQDNGNIRKHDLFENEKDNDYNEDKKRFNEPEYNSNNESDYAKDIKYNPETGKFDFSDKAQAINSTLEAELAKENAKKAKRRKIAIKSAKTVGKGVTFTLGAATLGGLGLIAGIASGDPSVAFKNASAGAKSGIRTAKNINSTAGNLATKAKNKSLSNGNSNQRKQISDKRIARFQENEKNKAFLRKQFNNPNEIIEKVVPAYLKGGVTNIKDISAAYKMEQEGMNRDSAIAIARLSKKTGDIRENPQSQKEWKQKIDTSLKQTQVIQEKNQADLVNKKIETKKAKIENKKIKHASSQSSVSDARERLKQYQTNRDIKENSITQTKPRYSSNSIINDLFKFQDYKDSLK